MSANPSAPYDVHETPGVCGGYPRIGKTRIPVRMVVELFRDTGDLEQTAAMFPQLTMEQVQEALAYYRDFPARVDEDIARNARVLAEHRKSPTR
jgi:uncharacterized protein (DUF433 family)